MSSGTVKPGPPSKPGQGVLPAVAPTSQTVLLDKLNARRSTPDSEALASSDDEGDPHRRDPHPVTAQPHRPVRRASWLNDTTSQAVSHPRKGSFASSSMSPTTSHPTTPSADPGVGAATWGSHATASGVLNRGHPNPSSFPWGPPVWGNERKEHPSRLAEVLPSPSSGFPPGVQNHSLYGEGGLTQTSPGPRDQGSNAQIPFAIPLHPTPKTYRSQSYSVGQLESDSATAAMGPTAAVGSRCRPTPHSGLQHRPSRPSMLSEMASDGSMLGKVNEDEDDDDSTGSMPGSQPETVEERLERLTRENTILKQREQQHMYQNQRMRPRASSSAAYALGNGYLQEPVPEESDYAIDELDESHDPADLAARRGLPRRMSEYGAGPFRSPYTVENRKLDSVKKAIWQSSLGFGGMGDISQSRRHSFADVPQRQGSIASIADSVGPHDQGAPDTQHSQDFPSPYSENPNFPTAHQVSSYFPGGPGLAGSQQQAIAQSAYGGGGGGGQFPSPYAPIHAPYANRPTSPHRNMYGMTQPRHNQLLHIVLFKCARADVFYIQEGTGLTVKPGDLVIVEADRGTDLGTVAKDNVDWQSAKDLKEHYAEEQYKWLMMYSQNAGAAQGGTGGGLMVASNGMQGSAVGGMGPPNPHHMQEPNSGELKPKLIKRLAQSHEIHALRDKEGNEAKAKRVCMQKVKEHGLNMEILDAEFQMDWKKLTFYYFADSYINFNSLVTDLFKIYKTRIWMSAINPASFASPTLGLQAPSGIGPGAVGVGRGSGTATDRRPNPSAPEQQQPPAFANVPNQNNRVVRPSSSHPSFNELAGGPASNYTAANSAANYSYNPYGSAFQSGNRPGGLPYAPGMVQGLDQFQSGFPQSSDYHLGRGRFPTPQSGGAQHDQSVSPLSQQAEWVGTFQGLSL